MHHVINIADDIKILTLKIYNLAGGFIYAIDTYIQGWRHHVIYHVMVCDTCLSSRFRQASEIPGEIQRKNVIIGISPLTKNLQGIGRIVK